MYFFKKATFYKIRFSSKCFLTFYDKVIPYLETSTYYKTGVKNLHIFEIIISDWPVPPKCFLFKVKFVLFFCASLINDPRLYDKDFAAQMAIYFQLK